eukprot:6207476-Pleurochrysis_carterae.AAC.2
MRSAGKRLRSPLAGRVVELMFNERNSKAAEGASEAGLPSRLSQQYKWGCFASSNLPLEAGEAR